MGSPFWKAAPDSNQAFDEYVAMVSRAVVTMMPGDYWLLIGVCPRCAVGLSQLGFSAHVSPMPKLPPLFDQMLPNFQAGLAPGKENCPACAAPVDFSSASRAYFSRVASLHFAAFVTIYDVVNGAWQPAGNQIFTPPDGWRALEHLGGNNQLVMEWGRSIHPCVAGLSALMRLKEGDKRPVRWISAEAVVTVYYASTPEETKAVSKAVVESGLRGPLIAVYSPPNVVPALLEAGAASMFDEIARPRGAWLATFYSEPAMRERLDYWSQVYGTDMRADAAGRFTIKIGKERHRMSLDELAAEASGRGFTVDEVLWDKGFFDAPMPGASTARPSAPTLSASALAVSPPATPPSAPTPHAGSPASSTIGTARAVEPAPEISVEETPPASDTWVKVGSPSEGLNMLVAAVKEDRARNVSADHRLFLARCARCGACAARLSVERFLPATPKVPAVRERVGTHLLALARQAPAPCPACSTLLLEGSLVELWNARVFPLERGVIFLKTLRAGAEWNYPLVCVLTTADKWIEFPENETSLDIMGATGRTFHAGDIIVRCLVNVGKLQFPVGAISEELYLTTTSRRFQPSAKDLGKACARFGLTGPFSIVLAPVNRTPAFLADIGLQREFELASDLNKATFAWVFSSPLLSARLKRLSQIYKVNLQPNSNGLIEAATADRRVSFTLDDLKVRACEEGMTITEAITEIYLRDFPVRPDWMEFMRQPLQASESLGDREAKEATIIVVPQKAAPSAQVAAQPRAAPGLPAAPAAHSAFGAAAPVPPPPPPAAPRAASWNVCRSCARPAIVVRRFHDAVRQMSLYDPKAVIADKALGVHVILMTACGEHLVPISQVDLQGWGTSLEQAIEEAGRQLPYDRLSVRRRIETDGRGRQILGLVGPFAASISTDARWMECALRYAQVNIQGLVRAETFGENVITFRAKDVPSAAGLGKELRKVAKSWGLAEPMIAASWRKEFARQADAAGEVRIEGDV